MGNVVVTGGAGFIGSHFVREAVYQGWFKKIFNLDALTYAGNLENLQDVQDNPGYFFHHVDLLDRDRTREILESIKPELVIHLAAESHVDRSIKDPSQFLRTNILGTFHLLEILRSLQSSWASSTRFVFVSTDEVYGSLDATGQFFEYSPLQPRSPYSVSKASADMLTRAYFETYGLDVVCVRCSNNYGPNQFPEKLIPQTILFAHENKSIPVYGNGQNIRDWIYVSDFVRGIYQAAVRGKAGEVYNFGGFNELTNLSVVKTILQKLGRSEKLIQFVEDRKGHDFRYAVNFDKSKKELDWSPNFSFEEGLAKTIDWYISHPDWCNRVRSGEYTRFFNSYYESKAVASLNSPSTN